MDTFHSFLFVFFFQDELNRLNQRDSRSLYIRFTQNSLPTDPDQIKKLHSDIKFVRTPRLDLKGRKGISYAFVEFGSESECKVAKNKLATTQFNGSELYVDFVGEKSQTKKSRDAKDKSQFNPTRLFISGLAHGVTKSNLKGMFPKCASAEIPRVGKKKGSAYGFIQFSSPSDAKAAFDAAQNLEVNGHPITVLFAKRTSQKDEVVQKKKAEKRKIQQEKKQKAGEKKAKIVSGKEDDEESGDDEDNDDKENIEEAEEEEDQTGENDDNDENDDEEEDDDESTDDEKEIEGDVKESDNDNDDDDDDEDDEDEADTEKEDAGEGEDDDDDDDDDDDE